MNNITVIGEGAWGTAIAQLLARNGYTVTLWCHDATVAAQIAQQRHNSRYMPGIALDTAINPVTDMALALQPQIIFISTPVPFLRSVLEQIKPHYKTHHILVMLNKGIENKTLLLPTQMLTAVLGAFAQTAVVAGPSFATQVMQGCITALVVASARQSVATTISSMLSNAYIRPYTTVDVMGAQVAAALKNVIALAGGMADGAGWCSNTKAFLFTRGLQEMVKVAQLFKGQPETIYGLAGVGDLWLTATNSTSRNYQIGVAFGQGKKMELPTDSMPEGLNTLRSVQELAGRDALELPICHALYKCLYENGSLEELSNALIT